MKGIQVSLGTWGFWRTLTPHLAQSANLILPDEERACMGHGFSKNPSHLEKAKMQVKLIKGLGVSQTDLPLELDMHTRLEGRGSALWQRREGKIPLIYLSSSKRGQKPDIAP